MKETDIGGRKLEIWKSRKISDCMFFLYRLRPDIRLLESGDIDAAASEKSRLEEKQRDARKARKKLKQEWKAR